MAPLKRIRTVWHLRSAHFHHANLGRAEMSASTLEKRIEALEAATNSGAGCERCRELLVTMARSELNLHRAAARSWHLKTLSSLLLPDAYRDVARL